MGNRRIYVKIVVNILITIIFFVLALTLGIKLISFFLPFVVAFIISMIANPLVKFMQKRIKIVRKHSSAIIIIVSLGAVFGLIYLIVATIVREVSSFMNDVSRIQQSIIDVMNTLSTRLEKVYIRMPVSIQEFLDGFGNDASDYMVSFFNGMKPPGILQMSDYVKNFANAIFMVIITILATYFFIAERDKIAEKSSEILPKTLQNTYQLIIQNFKDAVGGYFKAQLKIMFVLIILMSIAFVIMDVSYSFLLATGIAFLDFLPVFGTGAIFWPWALIDVISGNYLRAIFIVVLYFVCQLVKQVLQPKMVGDSIGIHPFTALLFMFVGYKLGGVFGMIVGIPIGMVFLSFYRLGMFDRIIRGVKIIINDINEFRKY